MNKSIRKDLRKVEIFVLIYMIILAFAFVYIDDLQDSLFNINTKRNERVYLLYDNFASMAKNLNLYVKYGDEVYYESIIFLADLVPDYLEDLVELSPGKNYVKNYAEIVIEHNNTNIDELKNLSHSNIEDLEKLQTKLSITIDFTRNWVIKDLELSTIEYTNRMNNILGFKFILLVLILGGGIFSFIYINKIFKKLLESLKRHQSYATQLYQHQWKIADINTETYIEISDLSLAMNQMKNEIKTYLTELEKKRELENNIKEMKILNEQKDKAFMESRIREINAKINPHFLFNSLNLVGKYAFMEEPEKAMDIIEGLSKILRYSLEAGGQFVELKTELDIIKTYIYVQKCRFGENISFELNYDKTIEKWLIPSMILQPLVENSFKHGYSKKGHMTLKINVIKVNEGIQIEVFDDGVGIDNIDEVLQSGLGVTSVHTRLALIYGEMNLFEIYSEKDFFTKIKIKIPKEITS